MIGRVANAKVVTAVICWATSHSNTGAVAVNSVPSFGQKSIEISAKSNITSFISGYPALFATKRELDLHTIANDHQKTLAVRQVRQSSLILLHHLYTTLDSKNWFPSTDTKRMIAKTSSHHNSSHPSTKKSHTKFG